MQCFQSWQAWWHVHAKQAPLDWYMDLNRKPLMITFMVVALASVVQAINLFTDVRTRDLAYLSLASAGVCFATALIIAKCSAPRLTEVAIILCSFLMLAALQYGSVVLSDDLSYRMRTHGAALTLWKSIPAIFGVPILPAVVFICVMVPMDIASLLLCQLRHADPFQLRMAWSSAAFALGWIGVAFMQTGRLRSVYEVQQALAAEKALMESIIAMMCDAIVWLSEDGSTVLRTDLRFTMLVGRSVVGEQVADSLAEEEHERVQDCLRHAKVAPALLPTTLVSGAGTRIPVDIFIVGNRNVNGAKGLQEQTPAFLIGIRMASRQGTEELGDVGMRQEHLTILAQNQADREEQMVPPEDELQSADLRSSSLPETSITGRIFTRMDVNRWLQGTPEDQALELRSGLERVDALGQSEHWLISQQDLKLEPDKLLGAGAFGVVVSGWLHGSPVAVKAARSGEHASVKHLVAIANEIRVFRHVRHPNITLFHGACVEPLQGEVLLVLERIKGPDLCSYVMNHSSDAEVYVRFRLLLDVVIAVRYLHSQSPQIVHGDLKGSNILVEAAMPRAKLVDFGLSRLLTTSAKPLGGSLQWMAPELILRTACRPRTSADVFSFGRLAYMILACREPLEGMRAAAIREMARTGLAHNLVWDEGRPLQRECAALCGRVLSSEPEERPGMREVHHEVSAWELPDLEEGLLPTMELARTARGPTTAAPTGHGLASLAGAMRSLRAALAAAPCQAPQPDRLRSGAAGGAANTPLNGQGGAEADALAAAGGAEWQAPVPAREEAAQGEPPQPTMALPARIGTQTTSKTFMLMDVLRQWNFAAPPDVCCVYHAAIDELGRMSQLLTTTRCRLDFAPYENFQCRHCGMLDFEVHTACPICNAPAGRAPSLASIEEEVPEPVDYLPDPPALCSL